VIDTGTGLRHVTQELADRADLPPITVLLTHLHMDHLIGLPSFTPLYSSHAQIRFMADPNREGSWKNALRAFMRKPYWPIGLNEADANLEFDSLPEAEPSMTIYGVTVTWCAIPHPQQCVAYRLESPECSVVIATDVEFTPGAIPDDFVAFCRGARHLIFDAHFTPAEIAHYKGWGHSTWEVGVELAKAADIARLVLTHHSPKRRDAEVDAVVETARASFPAVDGAYTNMVLD